MKYIVMEIQTNTDGTVGTIINTYDSRNEAERQYHLILAAAAISELPTHAAVILTNEGQMPQRSVYHHEIAPNTNGESEL